MATIETRLRAIEDRFALGDLVATYALKVAEGDGAAVADLFSEDGEFVGLIHRLSGRAELLAFYLGSVRPGGIVPLVVNKVFDIAGDVARGSSTLAALSAGPGRTVLCGTYDDDFVRVGQDWKFRRRRFTTWFEA